MTRGIGRSDAQRGLPSDTLPIGSVAALARPARRDLRTFIIEELVFRRHLSGADHWLRENDMVEALLEKERAAKPLTDKQTSLIDAYWRAANYLSVGQIYLFDNPLLQEPLPEEHIKPRLLGHWGTTPGLNFIYAHLNRMITARDLNMIYIAGPGHGGPGSSPIHILKEPTARSIPTYRTDAAGMPRLFKQFSFPGGIPSHAAPETPGSIHEGGELGYALSHAYGAAFDNPDLVVACVIGDGEAETGPLATSWHSNKFLNPATDGAVLPILHLNGYKIANPTMLARISHEELEHLFRGYGYTPYFVEGDDPATMHQLMAATLDTVFDEIARIQAEARSGSERPRWPMIVLRTPRAGQAPRRSTARRPKTYLRSHQVPLGEMRGNPDHVSMLEDWMRSYRPEELFDDDGRLGTGIGGAGARRASADGRQSARQRRPAAQGPLLPDFRDYAVEVPRPARSPRKRRGVMGRILRDVMKLNMELAQLPPVRSGREQLQPLAGCARGDRPCLDGRNPAGTITSRRTAV